MPTKETLCTRCAHLQVCCFKNIYLEVVEAIDNLSVGYNPFGYDIINKDTNGVIKISDITWLRPIEPVCVNYQEKKQANKYSPIGSRD